VPLLCLLAPAALAQKHELGLTLGGLAPNNGLSAGTALQANYGYRFWNAGKFALYGDVHFLANGQRTVDSQNPAATRDVATLYVTPGVRVKLFPKANLSPFFGVGGGYALYEQSFFRIDGASNQAPRFTHRGTLVYGGGMDANVFHSGWLRR